jgi:hypothetical protein
MLWRIGGLGIKLPLILLFVSFGLDAQVLISIGLVIAAIGWLIGIVAAIIWLSRP